MRIRRVTAHAFGHLQGQTLPLADGLTVVYGPNESGKSTWHAALLAALCGRWPSRARDEPGIERRRPWSASPWRVSAEVGLADGRRVELWHDLDARYGYAKDLDRVADYSGEITGPARGEVPDATRWLGLDRRAFVATACVRQSHLVLAAEDAAGVRGYVERAAATALADETAAAALDRIDRFQREQVGTGRSTTRPLPVAQRSRAAAEESLRAARAGLARLEERAAAARRLRAEAQQALVRLRRREAALAEDQAQRLRARAAQARELADLIAREDAPVGSAAGSRSLTTALAAATEVAAAVEAWRATVAVAPPVPPAALAAPPVLLPALADGPPEPAAAPPNGPAPGRRRSAPLFVAAGLCAVLAAVLVGVGAMVAGIAAGLAGLVAGAVGLFYRGRESAFTTPQPSASPTAPPVPAGVGQAGVDDTALAVQQRWREWEDRLGVAERRVLAVAGELGLSGGSAADAVRDLEAWLAADRDRQAARERSAAHRARLEALLDGASITELEAAADRAQRRAEAAAREAEQVGGRSTADDTESTVDDTGSTVDGVGPAVDDDVDVLRRQYQEADRRATLAEQALATLEQDRPSVAEAEERLAAAEAECRRLAVLDEVLTRTRAFLARAQERVHRDIAPQLASAVGQDLAAVTAGRYTEAVVDTNSLAVQVRGPGGPLRNVEHLSVGTVEQVYLLLRVALAQRLVRPGESCPLLLDDVTVHADQDRTRRLLDTLLAVAERHQVVLFTQQEHVRQWARVTLTGPRHALHELTTLAPTE